MKQIIYVLLLFFTISSCHSQTEKKSNRLVGGPCEGCEAIFEYGDKNLSATDTLPQFQEIKPQLKITGIVYHKDGQTPAEDVIVYIYQTNRSGIYETRGDEKNWAKRHGVFRGWIKTKKNGQYTFYTFRPAAYPNRGVPEHIHVTIKEPGKNEYFIDDFVFDDDPLLKQSEREALKNRGGSGIVKPVLKNEILTINRDLILGLNIPNYD